MLNSPICPDASLVIRLVENDNPEAAVAWLWRRWREDERPLIAPTLLYYEVSNALHRYTVQQVLLPEEAAAFFNAALKLRITVFGHADLHRHALRLANRLNLAASYDAHYLALAEMFGAEFWTTDRRLAEAVGAALPWVHSLREG